MKCLALLATALLFAFCNASSPVWTAADATTDAGDTDTETGDTDTADTDTGEPTSCVATALALYGEGCYLACEGIDDDAPTDCWWTTDATGLVQTLGLSDIESACLYWAADCSYHLGLMVECWAEAEECPDGCDGEDPNGVTMWECLE